MADALPGAVAQPSAAPPSALMVPTPRCAVSVRTGSADDFAFIDRLQKAHGHMVGWMPAKQLEGKIAAGHVLVAVGERGEPLGYCISQDRYFKRDDVGIVYQLNVAPSEHRN